MSDSKPPRRWRRWLAGLFVLLVVAIIVLQVIISWTDIPRDIAIRQIRSQTGLQVSMDRLHVGLWRGRTTMTGVQLHAPGDAQALATADRITAEHHSILSMLIGKGVGLSRVTLEAPAAQLHQQADGRWNFEPLIQQLTHDDQNDSPSSPGPMTLPEVVITNAKITAALNDGRAISLSPITATLTQPAVNGLPGGRAELAFTLADMLTGQGSVVMMAPFEHEAKIDLNHLRLLSPWLEPELFIQSARGTLQWVGRWEKDHLQGKAGLSQVSAVARTGVGTPAHSVIVDGNLRLALGGQLSLWPDDLTITSPSLLPGPVTLAQGQVEWTAADQTLHVRDLQAATLQGRVGLAGRFTPATMDGQARIDWRDLALDPLSNQQGSAAITLARHGTLGQWRAQATIHSTGQLASNQWESQWLAAVTGLSRDQFDWSIQIPHATLQQDDDKTTSLTQGLLQGTLRQGVLVLRDMNLPVTPPNMPETKITGQGRYDINQRSGTLTAHVNTRTSLSADSAPASARLQLKGDPQGIEADIQDIRFDTLTGQAQAQVRWDALNQVTGSFELHATPPSPLALPVTFKTSSLAGKIQGQARPVNLKLAGQAIVHQIRTPHAKAPLQDVIIDLVGSVNEQQVTLESKSFPLLDGWVLLQADHQFSTGRSQVQFKADRLPLASLDGLLKRPAQLTGHVNANLTASMTRTDVSTLDVAGRWNAVDVEHPLLHPTQAAGRLVLKDGAVTLLDILAESGDGRARGTVRSPMMHLHQLVATLSLENWPLRWSSSGAYRAHASGQASITGDLLTGIYSGPAELDIALLQNDTPLFQASVRTTLENQVLDIHHLQGSLLDGSISGQAKLDFKQITNSHADLQLADLDLSRLQLLASPADGLTGRARGQIVLKPAQGRDALGPMQLDVLLVPEQARLHRVELNELQSRIYLGPQRLVIHHLDLALATGRLHAWGRITRQQEEWFGFLQSQWRDLSFDQLASLMLVVQAPAAAGQVARDHHHNPPHDSSDDLPHDSPGPAEGENAPIPGLFNGKLLITGPLHDWTKATGQGDVVVRQSDLVRVPVLRQIYGLFNIVGSSGDPQGFGHANFRLEGPSFVITDAGYINRGVSISLRLRLTDLRRGKHTPITGVAMAIFNPLPVLPGAQRYVDAIMNYQGAMSTLSITGHLDHHQVQRVPATFIGQITRDLLHTPTHTHDDHEDDASESSGAEPPATQPVTQPAPLPTPDAATTQEAVRP